MNHTREYIAHAFHGSLPDGRASGTLQTGRDGLIFTIAGQTLRAPLEGLELKLGGASNRLIFCTHPRLPQWHFHTADLGLLDDPVLVGHPAVQSVTKARRGHHRAFWGSIVGAMLAVVLIIGGLYWSLDGLSAVAARQVPAEWEARLGESVLDQYRLQHEFMDQKQADALLAPLTDPLARALPAVGADSRYKLRFHIVDDPAINAFALPGGYMVINTGLILNAERAEALQGVLGHEIAHVTEQHGLRAVIRSTGIYVLAQALLGDASGLLAVIANAGPVLLNQTYSRDFEREADAVGYALLQESRINPRGMVDFFRIVLAEEKKMMDKITNKETRGLIDATKGFLSTHPETEERIAALEKKLSGQASGGWRDDQAQFVALKQAVEQFVIQQKGSRKE